MFRAPANILLTAGWLFFDGARVTLALVLLFLVIAWFARGRIARRAD
ncbi:hypothetical protein [Sphingomonas oryzagri]